MKYFLFDYPIIKLDSLEKEKTKTMSDSMKKYLAEMVGTFVLTLVGCGVAMFVGCNTTGGIVATALAFGLSVVAMAYCIGKCLGLPYQPRYYSWHVSFEENESKRCSLLHLVSIYRLTSSGSYPCRVSS